MNEMFGPTPEDINRLQKEWQAKEDDEWVQAHFVIHPEQLTLPSTLREAGPEIAELENMIVLFETTYSLEKLNAIVELSPELATLILYADDMSEEQIAKTVKHYTPEKAEEYRIKIVNIDAAVLKLEDREKFKMRRAAQKDIAPIIAKLNTLKKETNISPEKYEEINKKCERLMRALGSVQKNKVDSS